MAQLVFGGVFGALGCRFPAQCVKDPVLLQLQCRLKLQLGFDPGLGTSICCGVAKKEKEKNFLQCKVEMILY